MRTRRHFIAASASSLMMGLNTAQAASAPLSKASVGYRDVPNNGQVCAACVYFMFKPTENGVPQSRCIMVAGPINPAGWCKLFMPK